MSANPPVSQPQQQQSLRQRAGSFLGWAFLISILLHAVTLPFVHLKAAAQDKQETEKVSVTKKIKVIPPSPPPTPKPTPTPPPKKQTPPPVKQTNPPPVEKLRVNPPKTTSKSNTGPSVPKYVAPKVGSENGVPPGNSNTGAPAKVASTAAPAKETAPPAPTATPKPACAVPNKGAAIKGSAVEAEYPDSAREAGAVGTAMVAVTLNASGDVSSVSINKSAGNIALDNAAKQAAQQTKYTPDTVNCVPTAGTYLFQVDFTGQ